MSSKLHRGGVTGEPIAWRSVGSNEEILPEPQPFAPQAARTGAAVGISRFAHDPEQKIRAAYQQGIQEGQAAARQEIANQVEAMQANLARSIQEFSGLRQRFRHEAEEDTVTLALAVARRILHRELTIAPEALLGIVKAALEKIEAREVHRVRIRPDDASMVKQFLDKLGLPQRVEVVSDPGLARGAAILESSRGALDASVDTQLAEIERGLADLVRRA
jgi:flagellar assembly protein FliH